MQYQGDSSFFFLCLLISRREKIPSEKNERNAHILAEIGKGRLKNLMLFFKLAFS